MGFNAGEGVLDYSYCEEDIVKSAKSNIRGFIQIIIGVVIALGLLSFLFSTLIGSLSCLGGCMGCEACIETAACADDCGCADCDYESMTAEQVEKANERVSCDGYDCCGREGCLACGGCGDCSQCSGYDYDTITIYVGDTSYEKKIDSDTSHLSVSMPSGMEEPYYTYYGLFDKDGTCYVNENGTVQKKLKDGLVLYAKFEETNLGVQYELYFDMSALGMDDVRLAVTVGGAMPTFPTVPEKEGYRFKGWYTSNDYFVGDGTKLKPTFHLSDFRISPNSSSRVCKLTPRYEVNQRTVQFYVNGSYYASITADYGSTMGKVFNMFYDSYRDYSEEESFFGWATYNGAEPNEKIHDDAILREDMSVYAIMRPARFFYFYTNTPTDRYSNKEVKLHEGATNVVFDDIEQLAFIKDEDTYPGYKFVGWYRSSNPSDYDQAITSIDRVESNTPYNYYAKWEKATYTLTYWVMDHKAGELKDDVQEKYQMGDTHRLFSGVKDPVGYEFVGWCFDEDCLGTVYTEYLPDGTYGNKDLYAKFAPDTYTITLIAPGGSFNSNYTGSSLGGDTIAYGSSDNINRAYKEGYNFVGWFYGDIGTGEGEQITDSDGDLLKPFTLETLGYAVTEENEGIVNKQFTLFAKWTIKVFEVEFIADGMTHETCEVEWGKTIIKTMPNPEKEGHTFQYWTYQHSGDRYYDTHIIKDGAEGVVRDGKVVLVAKFDINKYTVTFVVDGNEYEKKNIAWNTLLSDVEKTFQEPPYTGTLRRRVGWYDTATYDNEMKLDEPITSSIKLYAKYDYAKEFTFNGAEGVKTRYFFVGDKETFPNDSKKGYDFLGWCSDEALTTDPVLENVRIRETTARVYYAKHQTIEYNIEYYLSEGTQAWKTDTYTVEDVKILIAPGDAGAPTKEGYSFNGWKWNGNTISELNHMTEHKKLYAIFTPNVYEITLGAEGNNVVKNATYDAGFDFGVPSEKEGYDFVGWSWEYNGPESSVVTDNTGKSLPGKVYDIAEDTTAYPVFRVKAYSAFWKDPANDKILEQTVIKHFEYVELPTNPSKEGYTFVGWYKDKACTQEYDPYDTMVTGDVVVWAKFEINSYNVTFVVDTGLQYVAYDLVYNTSLADAMASAQSKVNEYVALTDAHFVNWLTDDGAIYTASSLVPAKHLTLTAKFYMPITVHYEKHDGTVEEAGPYYVDENDTIYQYTYSRNGYTFDGWYTVSNTKQSFPMVVNENTPEDIYLYARWTANTYTITYYVDSAWTIANTQTYTMNETQEYGGFKLWMPAQIPGKVFKGWYFGRSTSGTYIGEALDNYGLEEGELVYGDIELYGVWEDITYSVKFFVDGVEQTARQQQYKNGAYLQSLTWSPEVPTGKSFIGWRIKGTQTLVIDDMGNWRNSTFTWEEDLLLEAWFI